MKYKYKVLGLLLCCTLLTNTAVYAKGTKESVEITTNKSEVYLDGTKIKADAITVNNATYLPLRKISEAMGLKVNYNAETSQIKLTSGEAQKYEIGSNLGRAQTQQVNVDMNSVDVFVDGEYVDAPNIVYGGTTYLPLRKISDAVGANVSYDSKSSSIYLSTGDNKTTNVQTTVETVNQSNTNIKLKPMVELKDITYPKEPKTVEDFEKVVLYMANCNVISLDIIYNDSIKNLFEDDTTINDNLTTAYRNVHNEYVDLTSWYSNVKVALNASYDGTTTKMTIVMQDGVENVQDAASQQIIFEQLALQLNNSLKAQGLITDKMSDKEVAKVLYQFVTIYLKYDEAAYNNKNVNPKSYTGYGAAVNQTAVCQGYTAFYNYLLKLNGIDCYGQVGTMKNGEQHIWTVATLDNKKCYIDVTHGDPVPDKKDYTNYDYFCISKDELMKTRSWTE